MMYEKLLNGLELYGCGKDDICSQFFGTNHHDIKENVVLAPWWEPIIFNEYNQHLKRLNDSDYSTIKIWNINIRNSEFTFIKTGIGAAVLTDVVLALGVTQCKEIIFIGSAGSMDHNISIGDIVIPEYSICGDGTSRYLKSGKLCENDPFGEKSFPNNNAYQKLISVSEKHCSSSNVKLHIGRNFSVDTIFAQFAFLEEIQGLGCNVIEMETAAAFKAAEIANISIAALFSVSDNILKKKSLVSGRTEEEKQYRKKVRKTIFPKVIDSYYFAN